MNDVFEGVVIDPGHGGVDSGARGRNNDLEKDYTLLISKYMYDRFRELGVPVYLTRDSDVTLSPTDRVNEVLSFFGNNPNVIVISNHLNAGGGDRWCYKELKCYLPQHFLNFLPLPHGHGSFLPIFLFICIELFRLSFNILEIISISESVLY